jgi:hypothetical protein
MEVAVPISRSTAQARHLDAAQGVHLTDSRRIFMSLVRYEPWDVLNQLHRQINRVFDTQAAANGAADRRTTSKPTRSAVESNDRMAASIAASRCRTRSTQPTCALLAATASWKSRFRSSRRLSRDVSKSLLLEETSRRRRRRPRCQQGIQVHGLTREAWARFRI